MCTKKLFFTFTLQEQFEVVLKKTFLKLFKKYDFLEEQDFVDTAKELYVKQELSCFSINQNFLDFLKAQKNSGKKIFLVSDFYCSSQIITEWFKNLNINTIFDEIFSSSDFNKEKATTKLYKFLIKKLGLNAKNTIMYGDNIWSDILMAKLCGLKTKRIKKLMRDYEK